MVYSNQSPRENLAASWRDSLDGQIDIHRRPRCLEAQLQSIAALQHPRRRSDSKQPRQQTIECHLAAEAAYLNQLGFSLIY
jgi:hypothetical protein